MMVIVVTQVVKVAMVTVVMIMVIGWLVQAKVVMGGLMVMVVVRVGMEFKERSRKY